MGCPYNCSYCFNENFYRGGGLYANAARFEGAGALIAGNTAPLGAGLVLEVDSTYLGVGDRLVDNASEQGGGIYLWSGASAWLEDVQVHSNRASEAGGGVFLEDSALSLSCTDCDFGEGGEDNSPTDIDAAGAGWTVTGSFSCDTEGCGGG